MLKWVLGAAAIFLVGGCAVLVGGSYWLFTQARAAPEFYDEVDVVELDETTRKQTREELNRLATQIAPELFRESRDSAVAEDSSLEQQPPTEIGEVSPDEAATQTEASPRTRPTLDADPRASNDDEDATDLPAPDAPAEPELQTVSLAFDASQLNAYLALFAEELSRQRSTAVSDPRVRLADDELQLGFRIKLPDMQGVVGLSVTPEVRGEKELALLIKRVSIGRIEIPLQRAVSLAEINVSGLPEGVSIPEDAIPPEVVLNWSKNEKIGVSVEALSVREGEVLLEIIPDSRSAQQSDAPGASSGQPPDANALDSQTADSQQSGDAATSVESPGVSL